MLTQTPQAGDPHATKIAFPGFALVISLVMLTFIFLLLVSFSTLTQVEIQASASTQKQLEAQQNALFGLKIALGELQKTTGPDQRATARADVLIPDDVEIAANTNGSTAADSLNDYWNNGRNRNWTGAWNNTNENKFDPEDASEYNPEPLLQAWLVSGNESTADKFKPTDQILGLSATSTAQDEFHDINGNSYVLMLKSSAGVSDAEDLNRVVTAPKVDIDSDGNAYAWWVGDEGVKARVNLIDPYANAISDSDLLKRSANAHRNAIEVMANDETGEDSGLALYPSNDTILERLYSSNQWGAVVTDNTWGPATKEHYFDTTVWSRSVLSDMRHGGLKRDLTYILSQPTLEDFGTALNTAYGETVFNSSENYNVALTDTASPYATLPADKYSNYPYNESGSKKGILTFAATWEQLWSYYNMGNEVSDTPAGVFNSEGLAVPRPHLGEQHGIYPIILQAKLFYSLRIVGGMADADGVNRTGNIHVDVIPMVVLANPYNVALAPADYVIEFSDPDPFLVFGDQNGGDLDYESMSSISTNNKTPGASYTGDNTKLIIRSEGIAPGEARIFSIDSSSSVNADISGDYIEIESPSDAKEIVLTNTYDPSIAITYDYTKNNPTYGYIPTDMTHVALAVGGRTGITAQLFIDSADSYNNRRIIHYIYAHGYDSESEDLVVSPIKNGSQLGGGFSTYLNQAPTTSSTTTPQQAPFYQVNYRGLAIMWHASSQGTHPLEWAWTRFKNGNSAGSGTTNPFLQSNLMFDASEGTNPKRVRWGIANVGEGSYLHTTPSSIEGETGFVNLMYDIPRTNHPLNSLGQLQHFNTTGHIPQGYSWKANAQPSQTPTTVHCWQVNYPISNSYPNPRVSRDKTIDFFTYYAGYNYDGSYIWNDILWDRFFFSSYPQSGDFDFRNETLINGRYQPFRSPDEVALDDTSKFRGDGSPSNVQNSRISAENLLLEGGFNVNSTSKDAWKALLSSLRNVTVGGETDTNNLTAPFARTRHQTGGADNSSAGNTANAWSGIRNLTDDEIDEMAEAMVLQAQLRGPFMSLADFVNRKLIAKSDDTYDLGLSGALQTAIDKVVNLKSNIDTNFHVTSVTKTTGQNSAMIADSDYVMTTALSGFPGYLLQADVLSVLGPNLTARSDTFTIRSYGEVRNPLTDAIEGRAWCEAIVQRTPDYVVPQTPNAGNAPYEEPTDDSNVTFGRAYKIVSFRWLSPDEV